MPIRTHRGRAAVYRKFWGWPVRSPAHLTGTVLAAVVIAVGVGVVLPAKQPDGTIRARTSDSPRAITSAPGPASALIAAICTGTRNFPTTSALSPTGLFWTSTAT